MRSRLCKGKGAGYDLGIAVATLCIGCSDQECLCRWNLEQNFPRTYTIWALGHEKVDLNIRDKTTAHLTDTFQTPRVKVLPFYCPEPFLLEC